MQYFIDRAKEPSTWRGLALFAGVIGLHISPEALPAIGSAVAAIISAIEVLRRG
jgi:hypothetical protein